MKVQELLLRELQLPKDPQLPTLRQDLHHRAASRRELSPHNLPLPSKGKKVHLDVQDLKRVIKIAEGYRENLQ